MILYKRSTAFLHKKTQAPENKQTTWATRQLNISFGFKLRSSGNEQKATTADWATQNKLEACEPELPTELCFHLIKTQKVLAFDF